MMDLSSIRRAHILIVDDQEANVLLLRHILEGAGYVSVSWTTNPREVAALHTLHHYDIILLDLNMPVMDGDNRTKPEQFDPQVLDAFTRRHDAFREIYSMN